MYRSFSGGNFSFLPGLLARTGTVIVSVAILTVLLAIEDPCAWLKGTRSCRTPLFVIVG